MSKLCKEKIKECAEWIRENGLMECGGAKLKDFCSALFIDSQTYYRWLKNAEFADAIKKAKESFKDSMEHRLVKSLAKAATGYEYEQTSTECVGSEEKLKRVVKKNIHVQPNVGAAIFLLTNIAPERWKNRQQQSVEASVSLSDDLESMSDEELQRIIDGKTK